MLTVMDCIRGMKEAKKADLKGKLLAEFYSHVLENATLKRTEGTIYIDTNELDMMLEAYIDLVEYRYDLKNYTNIDTKLFEDGEFVLHYNLEGFHNE